MGEVLNSGKYYVIQDDCDDDSIRFVLKRKAEHMEDSGLIEYCHECDSYHPRDDYRWADIKGNIAING